MVRVQRTLNMFPPQVKFYANEGNFDRDLVMGYCYPGYDTHIRLNVHRYGLGFSLDLETAKHLRDVLDHAIKTLE